VGLQRADTVSEIPLFDGNPQATLVTAGTQRRSTVRATFSRQQSVDRRVRAFERGREPCCFGCDVIGAFTQTRFPTLR
jgi:hypothetical protein